EVDVGDLCVALAVEADDEEAGVAVFAQGGGEVGGAGDAEGGEGARGGLPGAARDAGRAAGGDEEAVGAEGGGGAGDGAEVAGVGDAVEGDDERGFGRFVGQVDEVRRVGVVVGRDLQGDALVDGALGEPVELVAGDLHEGDPAVGGDFDAVTYAVVVVDAVGHVEGVGRDPGLEGFQDGVAAADVFGRVFGAPGARGGAAFAAALLTGDALAPGLVLVPVAHFGRRGRAPALEPAATVSAG